MLPPFTHDWRPGDRVASIAARESIAETGLGTIQRILLDRAIVLWDDSEQSEERLQDLIIAGFNESKIIKNAEDVSSELAINERLIINNMLISGIPLSIDNVSGLRWGNFINEGFAQGS
tara:strand:- start:434 stop:790 length:357 start_codon:yes stop_codon:yes gene_type:complete